MEHATLSARVIAVVIDLLLLAVVDIVVIYFTMKICGLTMDEFALLPKAPLIAFLVVQNGGYLVAFTAGGQTLGKMAAGIRVVPAESSATLDLRRAFLRTLMWVLLALPAGLRVVTAVINRGHPRLHDPFARTRRGSVEAAEAGSVLAVARATRRHLLRCRLRAGRARHLRIGRRSARVVDPAGITNRPARRHSRDLRRRILGRHHRRKAFRPYRPRAG